MGVGLAVLVAAPGIIQVGQIELVDPLVIHELQQLRQIAGVVTGQGETHPDLDAGIPAQANAVQRLVEATLTSTEFVVDLAHAIQTDADVVIADRRNPLDVGLADQGTVAGQPHIEPHLLGTPGYFEYIRPQQRLSARQDQHRNAEALQVLHDLEHLLGREFAGKILVRRGCIAVLAGEIAAPDQVPDHHRPGRGGDLGAPRWRTRIGQGLQVTGETEHFGLLRRPAAGRFSSGFHC